MAILKVILMVILSSVQQVYNSAALLNLLQSAAVLELVLDQRFLNNVRFSLLTLLISCFPELS